MRRSRELMGTKGRSTIFPVASVGVIVLATSLLVSLTGLLSASKGPNPATSRSAVSTLTSNQTCGGSSAQGYWLVAKDGGVFSFDRTFYGSEGGHHLNAPAVGMAADGILGYWLAAADGGVFTFGCANYYGSLPEQGVIPSEPIAAIAATPDYGGYACRSRRRCIHVW
jgi:hypothetical protein